MKKKAVPSRNDFFTKNERNQNLVALRISYYSPIAGILMLLGNLDGVFPGEPRSFIIATIMLGVQSLLMKLFCTINPEHPAIKYYLVITTEIVCFFLTITQGFEPFIIYALAPMVSSLYFNKRFNIITSSICYVVMMVSIYIRSQTGMHIEEGIEPEQWLLEYSIGLTLEYILNVAVLYLVSLRHLDSLSENLDAIKTFQTTQNELIAGYSELIFQAHQSRKVNIKRNQTVVAMLCEILSNHSEYPGLKDEDIVDALIAAVPLHDLGLIGVSDAIVSKTTAFTDEERREYQRHVVYGEELIRKNFYLSENREFLKIARLAALYHHEHWDGSGYPENQMGIAIPVCARIIAAADELEMRVCGDNEHKAVSIDVALSQIQTLAGTVLDPVIVEALLSCRLSLEELYSSENVSLPD